MNNGEQHITFGSQYKPQRRPFVNNKIQTRYETFQPVSSPPQAPKNINSNFGFENESSMSSKSSVSNLSSITQNSEILNDNQQNINARLVEVEEKVLLNANHLSSGRLQHKGLLHQFKLFKDTLNVDLKMQYSKTQADIINHNATSLQDYKKHCSNLDEMKTEYQKLVKLHVNQNLVHENYITSSKKLFTFNICLTIVCFVLCLYVLRTSEVFPITVLS
jgi:hypothetical protein